MAKKLTKSHRPELPAWGDVKRNLPLPEVREALSALKLCNSDVSRALGVILKVCETWLPRDLIEFAITGVEQKLSKERLLVSGYEDIVGTINGAIPELKDFAGASFGLDWKTVGRNPDWAWKQQVIGSWQWKIYAAASGRDLFFYRAINRDTLETREVVLVVPKSNFQEVANYLATSSAMRDTLITGGFPAWPQRRPKACEAWGSECPYLRDCENLTMPTDPPADEWRRVPWSYTKLELFYLCPERYRREITAPENVDEDDERAEFGLAVHLGLELIYKHLWNLKNNER